MRLGVLEFIAACAGVGVVVYAAHRFILRQTYLAHRKRRGDRD